VKFCGSSAPAFHCPKITFMLLSSHLAKKVIGEKAECLQKVTVLVGGDLIKSS
jgi:hypothetical protein